MQLIPGGGATGTGFGTDMPGPVQRVDGGQAFSNAGTGAMAIGQSLGAVAQDLHQRDLAARDAKAALALATITNQLHDAHDDIARGVLSGDIPADQAGAEMTKRTRETASSGVAGLTLQPFERDKMNAHITDVVGKLDRNLAGVVIARKQSETAATIDQFDEQLQRRTAEKGPAWAAQNFRDFLSIAGPAAGMNPEKMADRAQRFQEKAHYAFFDAAGTDALVKGDAGAVGAVIERVRGPEGSPMDPRQREQLTHMLFGYQQHILAKQDREANGAAEAQRVAENLAGDFLNKGRDLILSGAAPSPDWIKQATTAAAAAGPAYQASLGGLLAQQREFGGFAAQSMAVRAATLERMRNARTDPSVGSDPENEKLLAKATELDSKLNTMAKENPWEAAQTAGAIKAAPLLSPANIGDVVSIVQQRMADIGTVENWTGRKVSPLQPQEAELIGKYLKTMPSDQAMGMLSGIAKLVSDPERIEALADQLDKGHKDVALAMKFGADQTSAGRYLGQLIMDGGQAHRDKTVKVDDAVLSGWRASIANLVRGTMRDRQMEGDAIEAAYRVRTAMELGGVALPGYNLTASNENAVKLVVGQPLERGGAKFLLPRGMDERDFDNKLRDYTPDKLRAMLLPTEQFAAGGRTPAPNPSFFVRGQPITAEAVAIGLPNFGFQQASGGRYVPIRGNALVTLDKEGQQPLFLGVR